MPRLTCYRSRLKPACIRRGEAGTTAACFLLLFSVSLAPAAADAPVTVVVESRVVSVGGVRPETPSAAESWLKWARMGSNATVVTPKITPPNTAVARAVVSPHEASVLIAAPADGQALQAKAAAELEAGLYRVAAVIIESTNGLDTIPISRSWRMESVLLPRGGISAKTVHLRPGQILIVRWTETISQARALLQAARRTESAKGGPTTYTGVTIARALNQVSGLLGEIQTLIARGNRPEAIRRTHRALLYIAQAQAMARNRPGAISGDEDDNTFAQVTMAFSEISAAMGNLIPSEAVLPGKAGVPAELKVSLTNAGSKPISFVTLALPASADAAQAAVESRRRVFRSVASGATVTARFPITPSSPVPAATVQFIQGVGAALVTAAPPP